MEFLEGVVGVSLVAQIEHEGGRVAAQLAQHRGVVVEVAEGVALEFVEGRFQLADGIHVLLVEDAALFDVVGQPRIAEQDGDFGKADSAAFRRHRGAARSLGDQKVSARQHPEVLVARRFVLGRLVEKDLVESQGLQQSHDRLPVVQPLRVELIGDHAAFRVNHDFAADQALAIAVEGPFAADEMLLIDPLPTARFEIVAHPGAVDDVEHQHAVRAERPLDAREHRGIVLVAVEIAEGISHQTDAIEVPIAEPEAARVALAEVHGDADIPGALSRQADEIARTVDSGNMRKAAPRQFDRVPALSAAQVEDPIVRFEPDGANQKIDIARRAGAILDDVAVGLQVDGVEQCPPPIVGQVTFEIGNRTQGPLAGTSGALAGSLALGARLGRGYGASVHGVGFLHPAHGDLAVIIGTAAPRDSARPSGFASPVPKVGRNRHVRIGSPLI